MIPLYKLGTFGKPVDSQLHTELDTILEGENPPHSKPVRRFDFRPIIVSSRHGVALFSAAASPLAHNSPCSASPTDDIGLVLAIKKNCAYLTMRFRPPFSELRYTANIVKAPNTICCQ